MDHDWRDHPSPRGRIHRLRPDRLPESWGPARVRPGAFVVAIVFLGAGILLLGLIVCLAIGGQ